jgi:hypothetical protein
VTGGATTDRSISRTAARRFWEYSASVRDKDAADSLPETDTAASTLDRKRVRKSMATRGDPTQACPFDSLNGYHEWVDVNVSGTGDPLPGARECLKCGAFDYGPLDMKINHKDSPVMVPPAATRSFRVIRTHVDDEDIHYHGEETN